MRGFFGSPDALHAAFWPKQQQQQTGPSGQQQQQQQPAVQDTHTGTNNNATSGSRTGTPAVAAKSGVGSRSPGSSSQGRSSQAANNSSSSLTQQQSHPSRQQQQQPLWLQIDHAAVGELHSKLLSCRDDAVKDACCAACEKLLVHIATSAKQGRPNPGFCRQVRQGG